MGIKPVQTKVMLRTANGYLGLDLMKVTDPYSIYAACMPWGTPIGLYWTEEGAISASKLADEGKLMQDWRNRNEEAGLRYANPFCKAQKLRLPALVGLFGQQGVPVKNPQKHILLLLEDASWVGDGLVDWAKKQFPNRD
jgi:hypothetical protein